MGWSLPTVGRARGRAGGVYMAFAILGEALLLGAFAALVAGEPNGSWRIADGVAALPGSPWRDAALALHHPRLRHEDGARPAQRLDAADLYGRANPGRRGPERGGGQGGRHRPHPLPAARDGAAGLGRSAGGRRLRLGLLRRRGRTDAAEPEDDPRLFEHQPDGRDRRRARPELLRRGRGRRQPRSPSTRRTMCW